MAKRKYTAPAQEWLGFEAGAFLMASKFGDPANDTQIITPTDETYDGEFNSRQFGWSQGEYWND